MTQYRITTQSQAELDSYMNYLESIGYPHYKRQRVSYQDYNGLSINTESKSFSGTNVGGPPYSIPWGELLKKLAEPQIRLGNYEVELFPEKRKFKIGCAKFTREDAARILDRVTILRTGKIYCISGTPFQLEVYAQALKNFGFQLPEREDKQDGDFLHVAMRIKKTYYGKRDGISTEISFSDLLLKVNDRVDLSCGFAIIAPNSLAFKGESFDLAEVENAACEVLKHL